MSKTNLFHPSGISLLLKFVRYNLKIVFGNKFVYFLGAALIFYLLITSISLFAADSVSVHGVYFQLMFPAFLLIFFPTTYGIQNDEDARILEILFGIPNYRYKIWLVRLCMAIFMVFWFIFLMANLSSVLLINVPVWEMTMRLMVPVGLFGMLGFFFSTVVKNGNGTAVIVVILGLLVWFLSAFLESSPWNVFLNPFELPSGMSETVWESVVEKHVRTWLIVALVSALWGLLNLQRREKFIK
ncbi:hypothetical protein KEM09_07945 [Carboxylicivirga mesophila]|uniref:ABC transporter permease n=1 Tax=Carboxylicivirga mesophila TaxID=1166478 RepID=A0ABS5K8X7_9BACT|nr:hypothetical protein [Carboxylicivirga mesophila]MBS2211327.1 hypothetical protein [Carboxylicivirga mesophila]